MALGALASSFCCTSASSATGEIGLSRYSAPIFRASASMARSGNPVIDNGRNRPRPHGEKLQPVVALKADVRDDQVGRVAFERLRRFPQRARRKGHVAGARHQRREAAARRVVVIENQDAPGSGRQRGHAGTMHATAIPSRRCDMCASFCSVLGPSRVDVNFDPVDSNLRLVAEVGKRLRRMRPVGRLPIAIRCRTPPADRGRRRGASVRPSWPTARGARRAARSRTASPRRGSA